MGLGKLKYHRVSPPYYRAFTCTLGSCTLRGAIQLTIFLHLSKTTTVQSRQDHPPHFHTAVTEQSRQEHPPHCSYRTVQAGSPSTFPPLQCYKDFTNCCHGNMAQAVRCLLTVTAGEGGAFCFMNITVQIKKFLLCHRIWHAPLSTYTSPICLSLSLLYVSLPLSLESVFDDT